VALGSSMDPTLMKATVDAIGKHITHIPDADLWECSRRMVAARVEEGGYADLLNVRDFMRAYATIVNDRLEAKQRDEYERKQALTRRLRDTLPKPNVRHISELMREASAIGQRPVQKPKDVEVPDGQNDTHD
jgi:hypothetical protein